ncbi:hypothetical protein [Algoriphagus sp.]|uniref:hypothetical protein n=1 Tax=Algoriphagus sp. TaxID=1872435 RepID=UPI0026378E3E|nr:hypothetical protein [Algoriphagus sp.]
MKIFNLLSKALTGYKSRTKILKGHKVTYRYVGKPVLFDAFTMLMDFDSHHKVAQVISPTERLLAEIENLPFWDLPSQSPAVTFSTTIHNQAFQVNRYVHHLEHKPCSKYEFYLENQKLANFVRVYDYGASIKLFLESQVNTSPKFDEIESQPFVVNGGSNEKFLAENFGHSQFWKIQDWGRLKQLITSLG